MTPKDVIAQAEIELENLMAPVDIEKAVGGMFIEQAISGKSRDKFKSFLSSYTKDLLQSVEEIKNKPISEIIRWWEDDLTMEQRTELLPENWKGEMSERHARLRLVFFYFSLSDIIANLKQ